MCHLTQAKLGLPIINNVSKGINRAFLSFNARSFFFVLKICRIENYGLEMALQITAFIMPNLTDFYSAVERRKVVEFVRFNRF